MSFLLKEKIQSAMKEAMRAKEKDRLGVIRLMLAQIKQIEVDERIDVDDERLLSVFDKMLKQRRDSISQFKTAERQDLVDIEEYEITVIRSFMPEALTEMALEACIQEAIQKTGAETIKGMAAVMEYLRPKVQGRADLGMVGAKVKQRLEQSDPR